MASPVACQRPPLRRLPFAVAALVVSCSALAAAQQVPVLYSEGIVHGFLVLRDLSGTALADGDLTQTARGATVTSRLVLRFKDGSLHDDTTVFSQEKVFRLLNTHLIQRGPSFPESLDMTIDVGKGQVTVRHADRDGPPKTDVEHLKLPPNLANGMLPVLLKNVRPGTPVPALAYVAATPKPRLVTLKITPSGEDSFATGGSARKALHYVVAVELGGLTGLVAPLVGKQPPDSHVWILAGDTPAFVRAEQPLYTGGPMWRIELTSPSWPAGAATR